MRILYISPTSPWPANSGGRIRIGKFLETLAKENNVTMVALAQACEEQLIRDQARRLGVRATVGRSSRGKTTSLLQWLLSTRPYRSVRTRVSRLSRSVDRVMNEEKFDVIWCNCAETLECLPPAAATRARGDPLIVVDQQNVDSQWYETFISSSSFLHRQFGQENVRRLRSWEPTVYALADLCFCVAQEDVQRSADINPTMRCELVPNGVSVADFSLPPNRPRATSVLFVGALDVTMNQLAIRWFLANVWPLVREQVPNATFDVVGRNPPRWIARLDSSNSIRVSANVASVVPFYEKARVVVAPFEVGGGTKLKILEAFASSVPVVSTVVGARGLPVTSGVHLLVADAPGSFARGVVSQLRGIDGQMVLRALSLVKRTYDWAAIAAEAQEMVRSALERKVSASIRMRT
jgi:glycosyltransferase involved in cell wall biosynthesis